MYKVVLIRAGCCESALDVSLIEKAANDMAARGYVLDHIYQTSTTGCCINQKSAAVLVFKVK